MSELRVLHVKPKDVGSFTVRRALPQIAQRHVGPFVFFDHMGPVALSPGEGMDVRPHPHVGLATITYLFEGSLVHRDSLGTVQEILPGDVNFMIAGRGIVHSERSSAASREAGVRMHGLQTWVALPAADEDMEPAFLHHARGAIPVVSRPSARLTVIAGTAYGERAPVLVRSETLYVHAALDAGASVRVDDTHEERAVYVARGEVEIAGARYGEGTLIALPPRTDVALTTRGPADAILFGGAPLDGPRLLYWNFVATSQERIDRAKERWRRDEFGAVDGDGERIPLPE